MHNRNLAAQKGLFVLDRKAGPEQTLSLDQRLEDHTRKFCLPASERSDLLGLLSKLGIDRAHLMPSFGGVVGELKARRERQSERRIPLVGENT